MYKVSRCLSVLLFFFYLTHATNWYISPFGNNNNSGSSSSSPLADLKTALEKAAVGDSIFVATGTYSGSNNIGLSITGVHIIGTSGSATTVFLGTSSTPVIFKLYADASLQGLTGNTATTGVEVYSGNLTTLTDIYVSGVTNGIVLAQVQSVVINKFKASSSVGTGIGLTSSSTTQSISVTNSNFYARTGFYYDDDASVKSINISNSVFQSQVVGSRGIFVSVTVAQSFNMTVSNSSFTDYTVIAGSGYSGAGLYVSTSPSMQSNLSVVSTTFTNMRGQNGASLYAYGLNELYLSQLTIFNSSSSTSGGAIYLTSNNNVKIFNSEFKNCSATGSGTTSGSGGAIYVNTANRNVLVANSTFSNCNATASYGGAIYNPYTSNALLKVENSVFDGNYAGQHGGAIASFGIIFVNNTVFSYNKAANYGSSVYYSCSQAGSTVSYILYSKFSYNTAYYGGAIYASAGFINLNNGTFIFNTATSYGGAIYTTLTTFSLFDAVFEGNSASGSGGAMYITSSSSVNIANGGFVKNSATSSGGGFYCNSNAGVLINGAIFSGNTAATGSAYTCSSCLVTAASVYVDPGNTVSCASQ